jgi:hypothetical protein
MVRRESTLGKLGDEEGGIVIAAGILVLVFVLLGAAVVQVADWLEHRRHLQVRADAAALAGGQVFGECFDTSAFTSAQAQGDIENTARQFAGVASPTGTAYNVQFGRGSDSIAFQSSTYPSGGGGGPDDTQNGVGECSNLALDVKLTDASIPALFSFAPLASTHAHARVELQTIQAAKTFPLAFPDVDPKQVGVTFVDETTGGTELTGCSGTALVAGTTCTFLLTKGTSANGLTPWSGSAGVKIPNASGDLIGMRIGAGGQVASCAGVDGGANSACWDLNNVGRGVIAIRDYTTGGNGAQPNPPVVDGVWPTSACSGSPYFSDASLSAGATTCSVGVQAEVDFGTGPTDPTNSKSNGGVAAKLTATVAGQDVALQPVSYDSGNGTWLWASPAGAPTIPVDAAGTTSSYPVTLAWEEQDGTQGNKTCSTKSNNPCTGSFGTVQRLISATDDDDGPVKLVSLSEPASPSMPSYSLTPGTHTLAVSIALTGSLGVQTPPKLIALRLPGSGSRTSAVNCDGTGASDFRDALLGSCRTPYQINTSGLCPDPSPPAGAADCIPLKTGNLGSTVTSTLTQRFGGCPANNWPNYTKPGDKRNVQMIVTDLGALSGSGKTTIPVENFANFYIIGWSGGPGSCGTWPFTGSEPNGGNIWGYFVKYYSPGQTPSGNPCRLDQITPCVAVLTR